MRCPPAEIALLTALSMSCFVHYPLLVWNVSSSIPQGLYRASLEEPGIGDAVLLDPPAALMRFALERDYLRKPLPFVKEIIAAAGDSVCRQGQTITIGGAGLARAKEADSKGRPLPSWGGCRILSADDVFVLGTDRDSFDSRYFGPIPRKAIVTALVPLWTR